MSRILLNLRKAQLFLLTLFFATSLSAQVLLVKGTIYEANKRPLIGATVKVLHQSQGTVSNRNGYFQLYCSIGDSLTFSYLGYKTKIMLATPEMKVVLKEEASQLEDLVVVGYGNIRKKDLTGAISSIHSSDLAKGNFTSTEQALQGKIAGLSIIRGSGAPSQQSVIRLRGGTSLSAANAPLIVVDGVPEVDINSVNAAEIESVDVLKGASASAIYGSRGANGVIMINTIHSKSKRVESGLKYQGTFSISNVANNLDLLSARTWRKYVAEKGIDYAIDGGANTDWQKAVQRTALSHSHKLSFFRHQRTNGYMVTMNVLNNEGVIQKNDMDRYSVNLSAYNTLLNDHLKLEAKAHNSYDEWSPVDYGIFLRIPNQNPTQPLKDANGNYTYHTGYMTENPVKIVHDSSRKDIRKRILLTGKATVKFNDMFSSVTTLSWENNHHKNNYYMPSYGAINGANDHGHAKQTIDEYTNTQLETYFLGTLLNSKSQYLRLMLGYSYLKQVKNGLYVARRHFDTDSFEYFNLGAGNDYWANDLDSYQRDNRLISFYGRINYHLKDRYLFTATLRRDGSSKFGVNHKWGTFPSMSFAWRISDESFLENQKDWLNNLKFRVGYGVTGNQDGIDSYQSLQIVSGTNAMYYDPNTKTWKQSYSEVQNANPDLKWETTKQLNVGIDVALWNRVSLSLDWYHKKTTDLLWSYPVSQPPHLVGSMLANVGALTNKGFECAMNVDWLKHQDFNLSTNLTFAYNKQCIDKLNNEVYSGAKLQTGSLFGVRGMSGDYAQMIKEGYPLGAFWGPKCLGLTEDGKYILDRDEEGNVVNQYLGSAQPKVNLGFRLSANYKKFDLVIDTHGLFGQKVLNATKMALCNSKRLPAENVLTDIFTKNITDNPVYSDYWIEDASFFRIQSVTLGYSFNDIRSLGIKKIRAYLTAENLFTLTGYSGYDPEVDIAGIDSPGIDLFNVYPKARTFSIGVNFSF